MGPVRNRDLEEVDIIHPQEGLKLLLKNGVHVNQSIKAENILGNVLHQIGNTPLIRLNRIPKEEGIECEILAKCELYAPGGSHKDRIALKMIEEAESLGKLIPGVSTIIEPTSGNTGIGVAMVAAVKGYKCILVMPEKMSREKHETMTALGAAVVRTGKNVLHTTVAQEIQRMTPNSLILDQYGNQNNPRVHYEYTAEEIIAQCNGKLDMIVMGVGTGGVISGIGKKIKEKLPKCTVVGVDPEGSLMALPEDMNKSETNFWEVEGIGHDWLPDVLDRSVVDKWVKCTDKETFNMARRIIKEEGILCGGSCGSALVGAIKAVREAGLKKGQRCVILLPDSVRNYMTKFLSDQWMHERGFLPDHPVTQSYSWWNQTVSSLTLSLPPTLSSDSKVEEAIKLMKSSNLDQIPVLSKEGYMEGVVDLNTLLKAVPEREIRRTENVSNFVFNQYKRGLLSDTLGKVSYVLQASNILFVITPVTLEGGNGKPVVKERLEGIIRGIDLLEFGVRKE